MASDDDDCMDENKSLIQRVRECMGGESSGVESRDN